MITFKSQLNKQDVAIVSGLISDSSDIYGDNYITKNNLRLFIKENCSLVLDGLKKGDKIAFGEKEGVALVVGYSDKASRKYVKILTSDLSNADKLLKIISWNISDDVWCKIKTNNPLKEVLLRNGYTFFGARGKEVLLVKRYLKENSNGK